MLAVLAAGCSTRQVYDTASNFASAAPNSININTASADELGKLPTIGPKTAESIASFRDENGPFRRVEHMMLIRGISERRFLKMRDYIRAE